ncbi:hypothetical protein HZH68_012888 [Vespula germanica]|uniref:Uncharacterized protein n=1 Tax=Vespula germanica TaxID=30212 RepID=A0A834JKS1_VESGE|nr:hypothetical protein HZH68_012888 [Vespula germanica]
MLRRKVERIAGGYNGGNDDYDDDDDDDDDDDYDDDDDDDYDDEKFWKHEDDFSGGRSTSVRDNLFHENDLVSSTNSNKSPLPIISPADYTDTLHSCLYVSPDLPPCHFIRNENTQRFYRSTDNSLERKKSNEESLFQGHITVYSLQGCLPSRLPFKMALCESKESLERATKIWKLYPFQINDDEKIGSTFVFPRFDINRWLKSMRLLRDERDQEQRWNDSENFLKASPKYFSSSMISFDRDRNDRIKSSSSTSTINRNNLMNSNESVRRRRRRRRRSDLLDREIRQGSEFPYSKSIPFDPKRLSLALRSNKFFKSSPSLSQRSRDMKMENQSFY